MEGEIEKVAYLPLFTPEASWDLNNAFEIVDYNIHLYKLTSQCVRLQLNLVHNTHRSHNLKRLGIMCVLGRGRRNDFFLLVSHGK